MKMTERTSAIALAVGLAAFGAARAQPGTSITQVPPPPSVSIRDAGPAAALSELYTAMLSGSSARIASLLADEFTLTHMTGMVQPRHEWLADVESRRMAYHAAREVSVAEDVRGDSATVLSRHVVDSTIYGGRGRWNLQLATEFARRDGAWIATRMVASTF